MTQTLFFILFKLFYCLQSLSICFYSAVANITLHCLPGFAEFFPGPARREDGSKEQTGGGHSQSYTAGGGSDWSHPEGSSKGNRAGQVGGL